MYWNDHVHSCCSMDGEASLVELCQAAEAAGVTGLTLTDHCDLIGERGDPDDSFDWAQENAQIAAARAAFPQLDIRRGVELGQAVLRPQAAEQILRAPDIDFVLGSLHNDPESMDYYYMHFTDRAQCLQLLETYLESLLALCHTDYFDSLAHLTYPLRYMRARDGVDVDLSPFGDLVGEILKTLIHRGKALELNTSGYRNNGGVPLPSEDILRRYRAMGGELITLGSDAHTPSAMAEGLDRGVALLRACGFRYATRYQNRRPQQLAL